MQIREPIDVYDTIGRSLAEWHEPGAAELAEFVERVARDAGSNPAVRIERLKRAVYRVRFGNGSCPSLIVKRHERAIAAADRLLSERWLPTIGLDACAPRFVGAVAERGGRSVWHAYEDLGDESLRTNRVPGRLTAGAEVIARVHVESAGHSLLPEVRWRARDHTVHFTVHLRDAATTLALMRSSSPAPPPEVTAAADRLIRRLHMMLDDAPRLTRALEESGGPATLLHGDLWPKNVFVTTSGGRREAQLIDWDHVGVGSFTYDMSTFLYQSAPEERAPIWRCYRQILERAGWRLPDDGELNPLLEAAQAARYVQCILWAALSVVNDRAEWGLRELVDYDRWFQQLRPPLEI